MNKSAASAASPTYVKNQGHDEVSCKRRNPGILTFLFLAVLGARKNVNSLDAEQRVDNLVGIEGSASVPGIFGEQLENKMKSTRYILRFASRTSDRFRGSRKRLLQESPTLNSSSIGVEFGILGFGHPC